MSRAIRVRVRRGMLEPLERLDLPEGAEVTITIVDPPSADDTRAPRLPFPDRKISETFLDFASPLLRDLPSEAPERRAREALQVACTAWNAVIFADVLDEDRHLRQLRGPLAHTPEVAQLVEHLIARKRALGDDHRLIGTWEVTRTADGINLRADARDPYTVPPDPA
jgi:predicted DNA-binding antitoxin AbrB/MazE fold protein